MLTPVVHSPPSIGISFSDKYVNTHIIVFTYLSAAVTLPRLGRAAALLQFYQYITLIFALSGSFCKKMMRRMRKCQQPKPLSNRPN